MILHIPDVLTPEETKQARAMLDATDWVDGKTTAGHTAARVKNNAQLSSDNPVAKQIGELIIHKLSTNPLFMSAALPLHFLPPMFNYYGGGQHYGNHIDGAIRQIPGTGQRIRTDMSCTLFFAGPEEYDGGELIIEDTYGNQSVKLPAGHLVLYPSTSLHQVTPVTRGARISSFFWLQSLIRDDQRRSMLFDMDVAIQRMAMDQPDHPSVVSLTGIYHNLLRQWAEM
ncbi:MAG: Fe2+-dependent dioxygenase [Luteolibacter sp.]